MVDTIQRTEVEQLASFVVRSDYADLSPQARHHLKLHILDSLGCAIGALDGVPVRALRDQVDEFGGQGLCTLIGGRRTAPDRAACYNTALVRYLDFMDNFIAKKETCHPSDNLGSVLAAAEYADCSGRDLMTALAVAYQVECRLLEAGPISEYGFDHTTQGAYSMAAGISRALGLDECQTANAVAITGASSVTLWVTRIRKISQWKGLLSSHVALGATHATFLAKHGVTGPLEIFEAPDGYMDSLSGKFDINWDKENLECVIRTAIKPYNAEVHSQSVIEGVLELREQYNPKAQDIDHIEITTFKTCYNIIGGGEGGDKSVAYTKEQADHSLPYVIAVAILDGQVLPAQYVPERINRPDVQTLMKKVSVRPNRGYTRRYPDEVPCKITVHLKNGQELIREKSDFNGFFTRPMTWEQVVSKFEFLSSPYANKDLQQQIIQTVDSLENVSVRDLTRLLANVRPM